MTRVSSHLTSRAACKKSGSEEEKEKDNFANKVSKRIDNMNVVDHLLEHRFETLSLEEKLEVKRLMSCALQCIYVSPVLCSHCWPAPCRGGEWALNQDRPF